MPAPFNVLVGCSFGELSWMGSGKAHVEPLDPWQPLPKMSYKDGFQKQYFSLESFEQGAKLLKTYSRDLQSKALSRAA